MRWLDSKSEPNDADPTLQARATISSSTASAFVRRLGKSWKQMVEAALESKPQAFPLPVTASIHRGQRHSEVEEPEHGGVLPGSDPQLASDMSCSLRMPTTWELAIRSMETASTTELPITPRYCGPDEMCPSFRHHAQAPRRSLFLLQSPARKKACSVPTTTLTIPLCQCRRSLRM